jgi:hypothetical protein
VKINWNNTRNIPHAYGNLCAYCDECQDSPQLASKEWSKEVATIADLFGIEAYCPKCPGIQTKTILEWLGNKESIDLFEQIVKQRPEWESGIWTVKNLFQKTYHKVETKSEPLKKEGPKQKFDNLRDQILHEIFSS